MIPRYDYVRSIQSYSICLRSLTAPPHFRAPLTSLFYSMLALHRARPPQPFAPFAHSSYDRCWVGCIRNSCPIGRLIWHHIPLQLTWKPETTHERRVVMAEKRMAINLTEGFVVVLTIIAEVCLCTLLRVS